MSPLVFDLVGLLGGQFLHATSNPLAKTGDHQESLHPSRLSRSGGL